MLKQIWKELFLEYNPFHYPQMYQKPIEKKNNKW